MAAKKSTKTKYEVTISYKAVLQVPITAENEEEAKKKALAEFEEYRHFGNKISIGDDCFGVKGCVNMTESWGQLYS